MDSKCSVVGIRNNEDDDDVAVAVTDGVAVVMVVAAVDVAEEAASGYCCRCCTLALQILSSRCSRLFSKVGVLLILSLLLFSC